MALSDWQAQLGGVTVGAGTDYPLEGPITGLGVPQPRTSDLPKGDSAGAFGGRDIPATRTIGIAVVALGDTPADAWDLAAALCAAWAPTSMDTTLDIGLPGMGTVRWTGRPRGAELDLQYLPQSTARVRLTFEALVPDGVDVP